MRARQSKTRDAATLGRIVRRMAANRTEWAFGEVVGQGGRVVVSKLSGVREGRGLSDLVQKNATDFLENLYK